MDMCALHIIFWAKAFFYAKYKCLSHSVGYTNNYWKNVFEGKNKKQNHCRKKISHSWESRCSSSFQKITFIALFPYYGQNKLSSSNIQETMHSNFRHLEYEDLYFNSMLQNELSYIYCILSRSVLNMWTKMNVQSGKRKKMLLYTHCKKMFFLLHRNKDEYSRGLFE